MKQYALLFCLGLLLGLTACKPATDENPTTYSVSNEQYQYFVQAYTSGMISATSPIRLRFATDVVAQEKVGTEAPADILTFEPAIKGAFIWEDRQTLRFTPSAWLSAGQFYKATANLQKVYPDIAKELRILNFDFKVLQQQFAVDMRGFREESLTNLEQLRLQGTVTTTDVAIPSQVEKMLSINQGGDNNFKVIWEHSTSNKIHSFTIEGIERSEAAKNLLLNWNGASIGVEKQIKQDTLKIPSNTFEILDVKVIQDKGSRDPYILVQFSFPLQQVQDLNGLITLSGYENVDYNGRSNFKQVLDGSELRVYPNRTVEGTKTVKISAGIRSINQTAIPKPTSWTVSFDIQKPAVRLVGNGVIIPKTKGLNFPFEATKLKSVDVEIYKIYENNVLQFLQSSTIDDNDEYGMYYVGRIIAQKKIALNSLSAQSNEHEWIRYGLDLEDVVKEEEGAIYQVRLAFSRADAIYDCLDAEDQELMPLTKSPERNEDGEIKSIFDNKEYYNYSYENRDNPCYEDYYNQNQFAKRNVLGSNLGIIAKRGKDQELFVVVTDLLTAEPISGASVEVYDKVLQQMSKVQTDMNGVIRVKTPYAPEFVVVSNKKQKGYLRLKDAESLSLSTFETAGTSDYKGVKGYVYGERGVWRPGDSLYLMFVLEDKRNEIPAEHPVTFELKDPRGNLVKKMTTNSNLNGVYDFRTKTPADAMTGMWYATVSVGGATFRKDIRIETVKPNRLKIALNLGKEKLLSTDKLLVGDLKVTWLHGAPASNIRTQIDVNLEATPTIFEQHKGYKFDDPARESSSYSSPLTIFDAEVDKEGKAKVNGFLQLEKDPSGFMKAGFTIRAYEKGGDASSDNFSMTYSPYASYVGIKGPKKENDMSLEINADNKISTLVVDENGKPLSNKEVSIGVYKISWNWWYDRENNVNNFNTSKHLGAVQTKTVTTDANGNAIWNFVPKEWGRYMIRAADVASGHCSGGIFYAGTPWDDEDFNDKKAATMLAFSADKEFYNVGDEVTLEVPTGSAGNLLLTLENGYAVLEHRWIPIKNETGIEKITFKTRAGMAPTIYAHLTLLQPHEQLKNDLPIRSYGLLPIKVIDPKTKLTPKLEMASVLAPNKPVKIKVSEENKQEMTYTIAMVDEGLLDLTRFKTPDLWEHFYKKEAHGVITWDMFNQVLGSYELDQILAIGGDGGLDDNGKKANRFKPVVRFAGPFHLKAGKTAEHVLEMPNYVGSVRTMVVASQDGAYGKIDKTTPVRQPLMVLGTLPRVLSPTEQVKLPVTIFAMEAHVKDVKVSIESNDLLKIQGEKTKNIKFDRVGDAILEFDLIVADKLGIAKVKIIAESGKEKATYEVELDVRNPNPFTHKTHQFVLEQGQEWKVDIEPVGMKGTNKTRLEVSTIPPIDLAKRLDYLIQYPYGCIEQTTSSVFAQLFVSNLTKIEPSMAKEIEQNIRTAIQSLQKFQTGLGGFSYWPGGTDNSDWGTNYAGHFLLEAQVKGYVVPKTLVENWYRYQNSMAKNWRPRNLVAPVVPAGKTSTFNEASNRYAYNQEALMQAYRLYTLALAQKPDLGSMNKMYNIKDIPAKAKWRLAAAYALVGKKDIAQKIIENLPLTVDVYRELSYTYGSDLRDEAMVLETLTLLNERRKGVNVLMNMSKKLSSPSWYATQTVAYSLMAIAKFVGGEKIEATTPFAYQIGAAALQNVSLSTTPIAQYFINVEDVNQRKILVQNKAKTPLFASVIMTGQPVMGNTDADASNIAITINYQDMNGKEIDPTNLGQGTNFVALVEVTHKGLDRTYDEMALHQVFPAGWEIINTRMNEAFDNRASSPMKYQDVRDDRIYTYFDLPMGKTYKYKFYLNAAYQGKFYMPNVSCSAMYDNSIYANTGGKWIVVGMPRTES